MFGNSDELELSPGVGRVTQALLFTTIGVFLLQWLVDHTRGGLFTALFGLSRGGLLQGEVWQLVTYLFLHGGFWHLFVNMLGLAVFGREVEQAVGRARYLTLYLGCGVLGGLGWVLISGSRAALCVGASGAVLALLGAFAAMFPDRRITLLVFFVLPVNMTARTLAIVVGVVSLVGMIGADGNIAHAAHLAGGLAGYLYGRRAAQRGDAWGGGWRAEPRVSAWSMRMARWRGETPDANGVVPDAPADEEVDRILEKITAQGLHRLTRRERATLDRASRARAAEGR